LAEHVKCVGTVTNAYKTLTGKSEWKRPIGIPSRRWEDNTLMHHKERGWVDVD